MTQKWKAKPALVPFSSNLVTQWPKPAAVQQQAANQFRRGATVHLLGHFQVSVKYSYLIYSLPMQGRGKARNISSIFNRFKQ